jgi:hypothetical protein
MPMVPVSGSVPARMVSDPAGYFIIFPDRAGRLISLEHCANSGVLTRIIRTAGGILHRVSHPTPTSAAVSLDRSQRTTSFATREAN